MPSIINHQSLIINHYLADISIKQPDNTGYIVGKSDSGTLINSVLSTGIQLIFIAASIVFTFMLLWAGIEWVLSAGDKEKVSNARRRIVYAIFGFVILALTFLISTVVGQVIGFNPLGKFTIPTFQSCPPGQESNTAGTCMSETGGR